MAPTNNQTHAETIAALGISDKLVLSNLNSVVKTIRPSVQTLRQMPVDPDDIRDDNRVLIYVCIEHSESIRLELTYRHCKLDFRGYLVVDHRKWIRSLYCLIHWDLKPKPGLTVGQVLYSVMRKKRQDYYMMSLESGCRHWCCTVLDDIEAAKFLVPGEVTVDRIRHKLQYIYSWYLPDQFSMILPGIFYKRTL